MANIRIKLDLRKQKADGTYPVVISFFHRSTLRIATGLSSTVDEWNEAAGMFRGNSPTVRSNNARLRHYLSTTEVLLLNLSVSGELSKLTAKELSTRLMRELEVRPGRGAGTTVVAYLERAKNGKAERTRNLFYYTQKHIKDLGFDRRIQDVDDRWAAAYRDKLNEMYAANTVRQDLTRVGRAITLAMEDGLLVRNPIRYLKKPRAMVRKKALTLELLRQLRDIRTNYSACSRARDVFMLQFYLLGINLVDLFTAKTLTNGRLEYARHKTGTLYSVKVEPEAMRLIEKMKGDNTLIDIPYKSPVAAVVGTTKALQRLGIAEGLSTNWARHTWATIAAELEIPIETVSHALGHQIGSPVTAIYVAFNQKKVDEANRRVIDYINADLKGKE